MRRRRSTRRREERRKRSLGNITKYYSADVNESKNARSARARRYALQSVVRDILPNSRTANATATKPQTERLKSGAECLLALLARRSIRG